MDKQEFEQILSLSRLMEKTGDREEFIRSMGPLYEMMEKVRNAAELEDAEDSDLPGPEDFPLRTLLLREDVPHEFSCTEELLSLSERRDGGFFSVPRSI